jgi:hypothetical protein
VESVQGTGAFGARSDSFGEAAVEDDGTTREIKGEGKSKGTQLVSWIFDPTNK